VLDNFLYFGVSLKEVLALEFLFCTNSVPWYLFHSILAIAFLVHVFIFLIAIASFVVFGFCIADT